MSTRGPGWVTEKAVKARPEDKLPQRYYKRLDWFDNANAEIKILGDMFGAKPQVTAPLVPKNLENVTVLPPGYTFERYLTTLSYQEKVELTKYVFGEREEFRMVSAKVPSGQSEFKFISFRKDYSTQDVDWAIYYIINKFDSFGADVKPGHTTWAELKTDLESKYHNKFAKRGISETTGPVLWPGYNFVGPGNDLTDKYVPVSFVDSIAQLHDYAYGQRSLTTEHYDDRQLITMWTEWGKATAGDGWTGPTPYEKYFVIPTLIGLMTTKDNTDHFTEKNLWNRMLTPWIIKKIVSDYKNTALNKDEIHNTLIRYARYEATEQIQALRDYVREKVSSSQFAEHNALQQTSVELQALEREFRVQNRKHPDDRLPWFNNQQSINKTQEWKFGMSRFQYIADPKLKGFGYFIWGFVGEDDRIYPIIYTEDHPSDTAPRFPIVALSANPQVKTYVNVKTDVGYQQMLIPNYLKWSLASIEYQERERGVKPDGSFKKRYCFISQCKSKTIS